MTIELLKISPIYLMSILGICLILFIYFFFILKKTTIEKYKSGTKQKVKIKNFLKRGFIVKTYYKTGELNKVIPYRNGLISGKVDTYYKSGNIYIKDIYLNGNLIEYRVFDQVGKELEMKKITE